MSKWTADDVDKFKGKKATKSTGPGWTADDVDSYKSKSTTNNPSSNGLFGVNGTPESKTSVNNFYRNNATPLPPSTTVMPSEFSKLERQQTTPIGKQSQFSQFDRSLRSDVDPSKVIDRKGWNPYNINQNAGGYTLEDAKKFGKKTGAATMTGIGQTDLGVINLLRMINKPFSYAAGKLEESVTGKKIKPNSDIVSNTLTRGVQKTESAIEYHSQPLNELKGAEKIFFNALESVPLTATALVGGMGVFGGTAFGASAREAELEGANFGQQVHYGALNAALEMGTEKLPLKKLKSIFKGSEKPLKEVAIGAVEELVGEGLSQALSPFIKRATYNPDAELASLSSIAEAGLTGATAAILMGGIGMSLNTALNAAKNRDFSPATVEAVRQEIFKETQLLLPPPKEEDYQNYNQELQQPNQQQQTLNSTMPPMQNPGPTSDAVGQESTNTPPTQPIVPNEQENGLKSPNTQVSQAEKETFSIAPDDVAKKVFDELSKTSKGKSIDVIKEELYDRLAKDTDIPPELAEDYITAKDLSRYDVAGPFEKSLKPFFKQLSNLAYSLSKGYEYGQVTEKEPSSEGKHYKIDLQKDLGYTPIEYNGKNYFYTRTSDGVFKLYPATQEHYYNGESIVGKNGHRGEIATLTLEPDKNNPNIPEQPKQSSAKPTVPHDSEKSDDDLPWYIKETRGNGNIVKVDPVKDLGFQTIVYHGKKTYIEHTDKPNMLKLYSVNQEFYYGRYGICGKTGQIHGPGGINSLFISASKENPDVPFDMDDEEGTDIDNIGIEDSDEDVDTDAENDSAKEYNGKKEQEKTFDLENHTYTVGDKFVIPDFTARQKNVQIGKLQPDQKKPPMKSLWVLNFKDYANIDDVPTNVKGITNRYGHLAYGNNNMLVFPKNPKEFFISQSDPLAKNAVEHPPISITGEHYHISGKNGSYTLEPIILGETPTPEAATPTPEAATPTPEEAAPTPEEAAPTPEEIKNIKEDNPKATTQQIKDGIKATDKLERKYGKELEVGKIDAKYNALVIQNGLNDGTLSIDDLNISKATTSGYNYDMKRFIAESIIERDKKSNTVVLKVPYDGTLTLKNDTEILSEILHTLGVSVKGAKLPSYITKYIRNKEITVGSYGGYKILTSDNHSAMFLTDEEYTEFRKMIGQIETVEGKAKGNVTKIGRYLDKEFNFDGEYEPVTGAEGSFKGGNKTYTVLETDTTKVMYDNDILEMFNTKGHKLYINRNTNIGNKLLMSVDSNGLLVGMVLPVTPKETIDKPKIPYVIKFNIGNMPITIKNGTIGIPTEEAAPEEAAPEEAAPKEADPIEAKLDEVLKKLSEKEQSAYSKNVNSLSKVLIQAIKSGKLTSDKLYKLADEAFGGTQAQGTYTAKDAYDALELAVNKHILNDYNDGITLEDMKALVDNLPTATKRSEEMEVYQQFSTPPTIAYVANYAANITKEDVMLEPSAGIGGLAVFAKREGAKVYVNELSERRFDIIQNMPFDGFYNENAEHLNNILPTNIKPTVIVMNPPFSSTAGRMDKNATKYAKLHIEQALKRLEPNGRLVAIVGEGMNRGTYAFRDWWKELETKYNIRANIGIDGKNYTKYGTSFGVQLVVIDNNGPTHEQYPILGEKELSDVIKLLEVIKNDRVRIKPETNINDNQASNERPENSGGLNGIDNPSSNGGNVKKPSANNTNGARPSRTGGTTKSKGTTKGVESPNEADNGSRNDGRHQESDNTTGQDGSTKGLSGKQSERNNTVEIGVKSQEEVQTDTAALQNEDLVYSTYVPKKLKIKGAHNHVTPLVESAAMASVEPPDPTYSPKLNKGVVEDGILTLPQIESVVYAGQAHSKKLINGQRKGYYIGDGTGVGKGRQIAGIIQDNFNNGRKKAVWLSKNFDLVADTTRDWQALGGKKEDILSHRKIKKDGKIVKNEGILFSAYTTIWRTNRLKQIVDWLGKDFDGVIAFDEAHNMGNAIPMKSGRGTTKASKQALAGLELQKALPNARIVYVSATAATDVVQFAYAERLGMWGDGTPFPNVRAFIDSVNSGGLAAMELLAREMKAMGLYMARNLSFQGVEYETLTHELTPVQKTIYNKAADAWQIVLANINDALDITGQNNDTNAKRNAKGQFWGANQRFFNQIMTSMSVPSLIESIHKDLENGRSAVIQLVNTNEAAQERALNEAEEEEIDLEDLDMSPTEILINYLMKSFPIQQYEEYTDEDGNIKSRPVVDKEGNPVINREAEALRDDLVSDLKMMKMPDGAIDMIIDEFGTGMVAEITGRKRRLVYQTNAETGRTERVIEKWGDSRAAADVENFQNGEKRILIFSGKGDTGKSYHADKSAKNQTQRIHYLLQPGWNAIRATQGLGRTHRSNQVSAPKMVLVTTDLRGQKRFVSTIARRLNQMGAITKGQRQAGSGIFSEKDNLESPLASAVLEHFYKQIWAMPKGKDILTKMGLLNSLTDKNGNFDDNPTITRDMAKFLNRVINLNVDDQNSTFDSFMRIYEDAVDRAIKEGKLDTGLENYKADKVEFIDEKNIYENKESGAVTKYVQLKAFKKNSTYTITELKRHETFQGLVRVNDTGEVKALYKSRTKTNSKGEIEQTYILASPSMKWGKDNHIVAKSVEEKTTKIPEAEWASAWKEQVVKEPEYHEETLHLLTGTLLPIWDKLPTERTRVIRIIDNKNNTYLGRLIAPDQIDPILRKFSVVRTAEKVTPESLMAAILKENKVATFNQRMKIIRKRVSGENRIEFIGPNAYQAYYALQNYGAFTEKIQYNNRFFIPTGEKGVKALTEFLRRYSFEGYETNEEDDLSDVPVQFRGESPVNPLNNDRGSVQLGNPLVTQYEKPGKQTKEPKIPINRKYTYKEPELERQNTENRLSPTSTLQKIKEYAAGFMKAATRTFRELDPKIEQNSVAISELSRYPKIKSIAGSEASRILADIIKREHEELTTEEFNRFERFVKLQDLMEEVELGHELSGEWTPELVEKYYNDLKENLTDNIEKALKRRKDHWESVIKRYVKAMDDIGFDVKDRFTKENYFRHQVLEYVNAKNLSGSGSKINVNDHRGYTKKREGSKKATNEDYLQAEYEVLATMIYDLEVAKMVTKIDKTYNIKDQLKAMAREENEMVKENNKMYAEAAIAGDVSAEQTYSNLRKNIAIGFSGLRAEALADRLPRYGGKYDKEIAILASGEASTTDKLWEYISLLVDSENEQARISSNTIFKYIKRRNAFIQEHAGERYIDPKYTWADFIPEGYTKWQPRPGKHLFRANTISEKFAEALATGILDGLKATDTKVGQVLALGLDKEQIVIPNHIAYTLEHVYDKMNAEDDLLHKALSAPTSAFKSWVTGLNPKTFFKFNLRNMSGDIESLLMAAGFKAFDKKYVYRSARELFNFLRYNKFTPGLLEFRNLGGLQDSMYVQEVGAINDLKPFKIYNQQDTQNIALRIAKRVPFVKTWADFEANAGAYRESILRYSAYLFFKDEIKANNGIPKSYGASLRQRVNGLPTTMDKAYQLSKDALGAYDEITEVGKVLRKYLIPFYSFTETNMKRFKRLANNCIQDIKLQEHIGEKYKASLKLTAFTGVKATRIIGKNVMRMAFATALLTAWNRLIMGDEDDDLPEDIRNTPHLTLWREKDGTVMYFSRLGVLNDFVEWFGLDQLPSDIDNLMKGRKKVGDQIEDMAYSPLNKLINMITPFIKTTTEVITGMSFFPDIRNPKVIRDPYHYIAQSLSVKDEYAALSGMPKETSYLETWKKAFIYESKPEVSAYYQALDLRYQFEKQVLKQDSSKIVGGSKRSEALYYYKLALKYGDEKTTTKYFNMYRDLGGTAQGLAISLSALNPLYGLSEKERSAFVLWLSEDEIETVRKAINYYGDLVSQD